MSETCVSKISGREKAEAGKHSLCGNVVSYRDFTCANTIPNTRWIKLKQRGRYLLHFSEEMEDSIYERERQMW